MPNDYHPTSPVYDPTLKQDPYPATPQMRKMALDPTYYPPGYIPEEQEKDNVPLLVYNLVNPLERNIPEDPTEEEEEEEMVSTKTQAGPGQDADKEEDYYLDYSDSHHIY